MFTQPTTKLVQWQDFKVRSELDLVMEIAQQKGWKDCEIFGHGAMITEPLETTGWKLIPADQFKYSIPAEGVERVLQTIHAGVRIQGVIIADDERRTAPAPTVPSAPPAPAAPELAEPKASLPSAETVLKFLGKILFEMIKIVCFIVFLPFLVLGAIVNSGGSTSGGDDTDYDPKLIILVDDGNGSTVWISVLTWYD